MTTHRPAPVPPAFRQGRQLIGVVCADAHAAQLHIPAYLSHFSVSDCFRLAVDMVRHVQYFGGGLGPPWRPMWRDHTHIVDTGDPALVAAQFALTFMQLVCWQDEIDPVNIARYTTARRVFDDCRGFGPATFNFFFLVLVNQLRAAHDFSHQAWGTCLHSAGRITPEYN